MSFLLVMFRIGGLMIAAPFFTQTGLPVQVKVLLSVMLSFIFFSLYGLNAKVVPAHDMWQFTGVAFQEFAIGMMLGFLAQLMMSAIQLAGAHISLQSGLSIANSLDPISNTQMPVLGQLYFMMGMVLFLSLDMHHTLIMAVAKSFEYLPLAHGLPAHLGPLTNQFMHLTGQMFASSVMIVLPVFGTLLAMEVALAFMAKIMPQMNVFMVAIPMKILVAFVLIVITLPFSVETMGKLFDNVEHQLMMLYRP